MFLDMRRLMGASIMRTWPLIILVFTVFILGMVLGIAGVKNLPGPEVAKMSGYINVFLNQVTNIEFDASRALPGAVFDHVAAVILMYVLGVTVIGIPVILAFILVRGYILGFSIYFLASEFSAHGLMLFSVTILPQNLMYIPAVLVGGVTSIWFSLLMVRRLMDSRVHIGTCFFKYTIVMAVVVVVALGAAVVESYVSPWLTKAAAGIISAGVVSPDTWLR